MGSRSTLALALTALLASACATAPAPRKGEAARCTLNSECAAPLVCRLAACRNECNSARDCAPGLACVRDGDLLGVCQLREEKHCTADSACPAPLVCRAMECVNVCTTDRDCAAGAHCLDVTGGRGCIDPGTGTACVRDSECIGVDGGGQHLVCASDGRCRAECVTDRDCRYDTVCDPTSHACVGRAPIADAGTTDGGGGRTDGGGPTCPAPTDPCPPMPAQVVKLSLGFDFSCALLLGGRVACWGNDNMGQLGTVCAAAAGSSPRPLLVDGITTAIDVVASSDHACARLADGTLECWGRNDGREVDPSSSMAVIRTPVTVALPGMATRVAAGPLATYAIVGDTDLYAWGDPTSGALGDGTLVGPPPTTPVHIGTYASALGVAAWTGGGCVLAGGNVSCWGANQDGQAGLGDVAVVHATPMMVPGLSGVVTVLASNNDACAIDPTATHCWGANVDGELGLGTTTPNEASPQPMALTDMLQLGVGTFAMCAVRTGGLVTCWGMGDAGELGDGTMTTRSSPTMNVVGLPASSPPVAVAVGGHHACAIVAGGAYCWGDGSSGQLGDATVTASNVAIPVRCLP